MALKARPCCVGTGISAMGLSASASVMPNRYNWLSLDPTYTNRFGQPLMRMTFDFKENERKIGAFMQDKMEQ